MTPTVSDDLKATAYHEAGHAVAGWRLGCPILRVTVTPSGDYLGSVAGDNPIRHMFPDVDGAPEVDQAMREAVIILLAGSVAQKRFDASSWREFHGASDFDFAGDLLLRLGGNGERASEISDELNRQAEVLVERHWPEVGAVATALLEQHDMDGEAVIKLLENFTGEVVPISPLFAYEAD